MVDEALDAGWFKFRVPDGFADLVGEVALAHGLTASAYARGAINRRMLMDGVALLEAEEEAEPIWSVFRGEDFEGRVDASEVRGDYPAGRVSVELFRDGCLRHEGAAIDVGNGAFAFKFSGSETAAWEPGAYDLFLKFVTDGLYRALFAHAVVVERGAA